MLIPLDIRYAMFTLLYNRLIEQSVSLLFHFHSVSVAHYLPYEYVLRVNFECVAFTTEINHCFSLAFP